jgi:hypothetical protein
MADNSYTIEGGGGYKPIPESTPGGALRVPQAGEPANWFSVDYETVRAVAETHYEGDTRYGMENWQKGLPVSNLLNHAMEHLFKLLSGDNSEKHLEHAIWNLGKVRWMAKHRPEMLDVPAIRRYFGVSEEHYKMAMHTTLSKSHTPAQP